MYRVLGDFYPEAATPQLLAQTLMVPGTPPAHVALKADYGTKQAENMKVSISTSPETPVAGLSARVRFALDPADGHERYLGAWAHMLAASDDLIDLIPHTRRLPTARTRCSSTWSFRGRASTASGCSSSARAS